MDTAFLGAELRAKDPDRFLLSLFMPRRHRAAIQALFLLRHEISRTRDMVTDTNLGLIRLQWWRDEIARIYDGRGCGEIPVLSTLAPVIQVRDIPQDWFNTLIYAHEFDLEDVAPETIDGLWKYVDFTATPVTQIAMKILGEAADPVQIQKISQNSAILEIIRSVPLMLSHHRCFLPRDMLAAKNLSPQKIMDFNHKDKILEIVKTIALSVRPYRKPKTRYLKYLQRMNDIHLKKLRKNNFDVFLSTMQMQPAFMAVRMSLPALI